MPCSLRLAAAVLCLQELGDARPDVQDAVAKLCCTWWQYGAENREFLVSQTLPFLLVGGCNNSRLFCCSCWLNKWCIRDVAVSRLAI